jgi:hypothetical protein
MVVFLTWFLLTQAVRLARGTGLPPSLLNQHEAGESCGFHTTLAHRGRALHCAQQSAALAPAALVGATESPSTSCSAIKSHEAGAASAPPRGGSGGRALGSSPSGLPLGCALSLSTPATQPLEGQEGQATRLWSSSTTVCMTKVAYTPVEVLRMTWHSLQPSLSARGGGSAW